MTRMCTHTKVIVTHYDPPNRWARVVCTECNIGRKGCIGDLWIAPWAQREVIDYEKAMVLLEPCST